jgi:hypothetical protein
MNIEIKNPVIVTALYDIGRDKWEKFTQSYGGYMHWFWRTLSLDSEMVIYTQERFKNEILEYRTKFDPDLSKTVIVIQELDELEAYKKYNDRLENLMFSDEFKSIVSFHDVPEMSKPLYNVIMFNKVFWLKHTVDNKFFDNDLVIWADAGGLRDEISKYENTKWPSLEKVNELDNSKITFFSHKEDFDIPEDQKQFISLSQVRSIQGTAFLAPSNKVDWLVNEVVQTIEESLNSGYIGSDEKIFDISYVRNKNEYNLIVCGWRTYFPRFEV